MRFAAGWLLSSLVTPPPIEHVVQVPTVAMPVSTFHSTAQSWLLTEAPSPSDIALLRQALAEFYGVDRNLARSEELLTSVIDRWQSQPPDELAALYRVRGDCYIAEAQAQPAAEDYATALKLLNGPGGDKADPSELPAAYLGRARALKSLQNPALAKEAAKNYRLALQLSSREDWETEQELLEDGATRNPYAAWEWGAVLRTAGDYVGASTAHALSAGAFDDIGDKAGSVISWIDAGIDLAAADQVSEAESLLRKGIAKTPGVEGRDVALLQRVIAKEGEGRLALASLLWSDGQRAEAETVLGDACIRLDQLQADAAQRKAPPLQNAPTALRFSIDDDSRPLEVSCARFKSSAFLDELGWSPTLQQKVSTLQNLR